MALAFAPAVARERLFCRFSGVEITDCGEQVVPVSPVVQAEGCCDRQVTGALGPALGGQQQELNPPTLAASPAVPAIAPVDLAPPVRPPPAVAVAAGPPLFVITRALLL